MASGKQGCRMKSSYKSFYERKKYIYGFAWIGIVALCVFAVWFYISFGGNVLYTAISIGMIAAVMVILFVIGYRNISRVYREVENISDKMISVIDDPDSASEEEFRQGSMGILYTNFYKMVSFLRESREKELSEKIFLRDIISDISHQLKTPLATLNVFVDMLLDDKVSDPERRRQVLIEAQNQLSRMEWMVLSLLKLARIEAGAIEFQKQSWNMDVICSQAADGVRYLTAKRGQNVNIDCDDELKLECDGDWLTEAIINLLKNASDYSESGTNIDLKVEQNDLFTRIYVRDYGMGIPENEIPNIFKRFYRVDHDVNPNSVGIGLSLTKSIVEGMGGRITVKSVLNEYTCFEITFVHI